MPRSSPQIVVDKNIVVGEKLRRGKIKAAKIKSVV
jgi:hypothetical protein